MPEQPPLAFGPFVLQVKARRLLENGKAVALGARAFDLLAALIEGRERTMSKDELMRLVWPGSVVDENNLTVNISALRKALRERVHEQTYIRTVSGRGYRFVGEVRPDWAAAVPATGQSPETPSIAVLPFTNMSLDPAHEHFGDGIVEDIIADLSRNRWLTVISRNSTFTFKGQAVDVQEVARQFNVRYVLEGSVRRSGERLRVTVRLVDATTRGHLLSERYDRQLADIFDVQDEITALITDAVRPALYEAEEARSIRKHPASLDAWAAYQRGVWHFSHPGEPESNEARACFERAIALDPHYAPGYYGLSLVYLHDGSIFALHAPSDWQQRGEQLTIRAVELDEQDSGAHCVLGVARRLRGDYAGSLESCQRALELNHNDATAHGTAGATLIFDGRPLEGLEAIKASLRLSPRDPRLRIRHAHRALGHYFSHQMEETEEVARFIIRTFPDYSFGPRMLAIVLAETGRVAEARCAFQAALAMAPEYFADFSQSRMPWYRPDDHRRVVAALRLAGFTGKAE